MKKSILSFVMALFVAQLAHSAEKWELPKATLRSVYMPQSKTGNIELIRLYSDKTFEHLIYEPTGYSKNNPAKELKFHLSKVEINKGKYSLESGSLKLMPLDREFSSALYDKTYFIENSRVYESRWKSIFKKDQFLLKSVSKAKYDMPFFLDPYSHLIVTNEDAAERIDLSLVVNYLVKNITDQKEKLHQLVSFIRSSIEYDYAGAESKKFLNDQNDAAAIIAGKNRLAVCAGYALTLKDLLSRTGMEAKYVTGYARVNKYETNELGELHAWNIVTIGKSKEIHDITWGEQWYDVDPAIMIHSHFPEDPDDQLLEKPITKEQYKQMPFAEPKGKNARYLAFLPMRGRLTAKDELQFLFDGPVGNLSVEQYNPNGSDESAHFNSVIRTIPSGGKTAVTIPLKFKKSYVTILTSAGFELTFEVDNNGIPEKDIENYFLQNRPVRIVQPVAEKKIVLIPVDKTVTTKSVDFVKLNKTQQLFYHDLTAVGLKADYFEIPMIKEAVKYYGLKEIPGVQHNDQILKFFKETGNGKIRTDEDAWCSVFVSFCAKQNGFDFNKKATAKSWMEVGKEVKNPLPGDVVIFWRDDKNSWKGHAAIYIGKDEAGNIICIGGNQDDEVNIGYYSSERVVGFRRLIP